MEDESYLFDASQERDYLMHVRQVVGHRSDGLSEIISPSGEVIGNDPLEMVISKIGNAVIQQQILDTRLKNSLSVSRPQFSSSSHQERTQAAVEVISVRQTIAVGVMEQLIGLGFRPEPDSTDSQSLDSLSV